MERVQVRIASDDGAWLEALRRRLAPIEDIVVLGGGPLGQLGAGPAAAVVLVDGGPAPDTALDAVGAQVRAGQSAIFVLLVRADHDLAALYPRAALAGVRIVLPESCELPELAEGIYKAADCLAAAAPARATNGGGPDRIFTVFGTKGGVGRTTLAVNLAAAFAARGLRTALLDLDFAWGNAVVHLRGTPPRPFGELLAETKNLDGDLLQSFMVRHASGVHVLPAAPRPEMAEFVHAEQVQAVVATAREAFDAVVVDTPVGFPETAFPALESADHVLLVTVPEVPALRNTRAAVGVLEMLQLGRAKTHIVLNRATRSHGVRRADVEATLGTPIWAALPADEAAAARSGNQGMPTVTLFPSARLSRAVTAMARRLLPEGHGRVRPAHRPPLRAARARS